MQWGIPSGSYIESLKLREGGGGKEKKVEVEVGEAKKQKVHLLGERMVDIVEWFWEIWFELEY